MLDDDDVLESCIIDTAESCEVEFTLEAAQSMEDEVQKYLIQLACF